MKTTSRKVNSVLVIDVGGTHVKVMATGQREERRIPSGPKMTAATMVRDVKRLAKGWQYDCASIGYPGPVIHGHPSTSPTISAAAGSDSISARPSAVPLRLLMTPRCRLSEATKGAGCCFWASARGSGRP
jgi:hypothetical protein